MRAGKHCALLYIVFVAGFAAVKFFSPIELLPWAELFYGPAITVVSCFLLFAIAIWIGWRRNWREA